MSVVQEVLEMLGCESEMDAYRKKYLALKMRCEQIQQANEKLVNRLYHVKKLTKQYKKERRALMAKLDEHGDKYEEAMVPAQWDESQIYYMLAGRHPEEEPSPGGAAGQSQPGKRPVKKASQPRRPNDAFAIFCQQRQAAVVQQYYKENNNDISDEELNRRLTQQWNLLPQDDKQVYQELFKKQREAETGMACKMVEEEEDALAHLHGDDPEAEDVQI